MDIRTRETSLSKSPSTSPTPESKPIYHALQAMFQFSCILQCFLPWFPLPLSSSNLYLLLLSCLLHLPFIGISTQENILYYFLSPAWTLLHLLCRERREGWHCLETHIHFFVIILVHRREGLLCPLCGSCCSLSVHISSVYILGAKGIFGFNYTRLIRYYVKVVIIVRPFWPWNVFIGYDQIQSLV